MTAPAEDQSTPVELAYPIEPLEAFDVGEAGAQDVDE